MMGRYFFVDDEFDGLWTMLWMLLWKVGFWELKSWAAAT